jgi:hypothetical protein
MTPTSIFKLPNELLELIFAHTLFLDQCEFNFDGNGPLQPFNPHDDNNVSHLSTIALVCRRFHQVASNISIWHNHKFEAVDFLQERSDQLPDSKRLVYTPAGEFYVPQRMLCILRVCSMFLDIIESQSPFDKTIESLTLYAVTMNYSGVETKLPRRFIEGDKLSLCSHITILRLQWITGVNLDTICELFPFLEQLYIGAFSEFSGTLKTLTQLRILHIDNQGDSEPSETSAIFPINSANTLTHLSFRNGLHDAFDLDIHLIGHFTFLQHLTIEPLTAHVCTSIMNANLRLTTFKTQLPWTNNSVDIPMIANFLSSPCFRTLETLMLHLFYWDAFPHYYPPEDFTPVVEEITNIPTLQYLRLGIPFDLAWCPKFVKLRDLQSIEWIVEGSRFHPPCTMQEVLEAFKIAYIEYDGMPSLVFSGGLIGGEDRHAFEYFEEYDNYLDEDEDNQIQAIENEIHVEEN